MRPKRLPTARGTVDLYVNGAGRPVVLVHASGMGARRWNRVFATWRGRFHLHAPNLLGYGASGPWSEAAYSIDDEVTLIDAVVDDIAAPVHLIGHSFGGYVVQREIGSGGMGRVFLARPAAPEPERADRAEAAEVVAIKILRPELLHSELVERFEVEKSFLAGIDHPNIARLLDAGTRPPQTGPGPEQPYFVMEYIEGLEIDRFCEERDLGLRGRIILFRKLCSGAHFLHQNLVVHRDIKPSNVLVTSDGEPKLLDFGIAKFLDPSGLRFHGDETRADVRLFTPDYASPEQVLGETITTATDVFSLGALLYLLLTGQKIRNLESHSYPEVVRAVSEETPVRPSTTTGAPPAILRTSSVCFASLAKAVTGRPSPSRARICNERSLSRERPIATDSLSDHTPIISS